MSITLVSYQYEVQPRSYLKRFFEQAIAYHDAVSVILEMITLYKRMSKIMPQIACKELT